MSDSPAPARPPRSEGGAFARFATFDARGFALLRVHFGCLLFFELLRRFPHRYLFMAGDGLLPAPVASYVDAEARPSLLSMSATHGEIDAFFFVGFVAAVLLVLGLWTRFASVAAWIVILSITNRTLAVVTGGEMLLSLIALYLIFAPTSLRYSLDAHFRHRDGSPPPRTVVSATGVVLLLQWAVIYATTGLAKHGPSWLEGHAVSESLRASHVVSPLGAMFADLPPLVDRALSWSTLVVEVTLPLLIITPWRRRGAHLLAAGIIFALHLGIAIFLSVGVFSYAMWTILPLLIPSDVYDTIERRVLRVPVSFVHVMPDRLRRVGGVVLVLAFVAGSVEFGLWMARRLNVAYTRPERLDFVVRSLSFSQNWALFAPNPPEYGRVLVIAARTREGREVDPLRYAFEGDDRVRRVVPPTLEPNHIVASYLNRVRDLGGTERSRLEGLARVIRDHPRRTGRPEDTIVSYRITSLSAPTRDHSRRDPRPDAAAHTRALLGAAHAHVVPIARVRGTFVYEPSRAGDGVLPPRGADGRTPLAAIFDSRCGAIELELAREARPAALVVSLSRGATFLIEGDGVRLARPRAHETETDMTTQVIALSGKPIRRLRVTAVDGPGIASVGEILVLEVDDPGVRARIAQEPVVRRPKQATRDLPLYEPVIFGPAVGSVCAGRMRTIPPMLAAETALPR